MTIKEIFYLEYVFANQNRTVISEMIAVLENCRVPQWKFPYGIGVSGPSIVYLLAMDIYFRP